MSDTLYLTNDEFRARLRADVVTALTADLADADAETTLTAAIREAGQKFEGLVAGRYAIPLVATEIIKGHVAKLGEPILYGRLRWNIDETMLKEQAALEKLLLDGRYQLVGQRPARPTASQTNVRETTPSARVTGSAREFTRNELKGF